MASSLVSQSLCIGKESVLEKATKQLSPFRCNDTDIILYRDIECVEKEKARSSQQKLAVFEKTTIASRARSRNALKELEAAIERDTEGTIEKDLPALNWALAFAKCLQSDKQSITDYINEQKELFLLEYAVKTKQRAISNMENMVANEERKARIAEMKLEEDSLAFEEFLRENDKSSVEALKLATQEAKAKMEVMAEVRTAMNEVLNIKSEIANTEDRLRLYLSYEDFLLSISPIEWQEKHLAKRKKKKKDNKSYMSVPTPEKPRLTSASFLIHHRLHKWAHAKDHPTAKGVQPAKKTAAGKSLSDMVPQHEEKKSPHGPALKEGDYKFFKKSTRGLSQRSSLEDKKNVAESSVQSERSMSVSSEEDFSLDDIQSDEEKEIYFKDPEELLQMFRHLEEQNLSLFQNVQEISGAVEDRLQENQAVQRKMEEIIKSLVDEEEALKAACTKEEAKSAELELKAKLFSTEDYNSLSMDKMLKTLTKKVGEVYKVCCGAEEVASMSPFHMLKVIEIRVSELCEMLETLPKEYIETVEANEKLRAKARRQRVREDKLKELKKIQEQRVMHALERAIAAPKTRVGRKLVCRSQPPKTSHEKENIVDSTTKSEDDYFFT